MLSVDCVKMRRRMIPEEELYYYSVKSRYFWHILTLIESTNFGP